MGRFYTNLRFNTQVLLSNSSPEKRRATTAAC